MHQKHESPLVQCGREISIGEIEEIKEDGLRFFTA